MISFSRTSKPYRRFSHCLGALRCLLVFVVANATFLTAQQDVWMEHMKAAKQAKEAGRIEEAERNYRLALDQASKSAEDVYRLRSTVVAIGELLENQGKYSEAEAVYRQALQINEMTLKHAKRDAAYWLRDLMVAEDVGNIARVLFLQKRPADSEPLYLRAVELREEALRRVERDLVARVAAQDMPLEQELASDCEGLAQLYVSQNSLEKAEALFKRALDLRGKKSSKGKLELLPLLDDYSTLLRRMGRAAEAEKLANRARKIREKAPRA